MQFSIVLVGLFTGLVSVYAYPTGAPSSVCETMIPGHGAQPQTSPFPYDIDIEKSYLKPGETTKVTVKGKNGLTFRGHFIQARSGDTRVGKFSVIDNNSHLIDCGPGKGDAATQSNAQDKNEITVNWTAPEDFKGDVIFYVTIVKVFDTYWVAQKSSAVQVS